MNRLTRALDSDVVYSFRTSPVAVVSALIAAICIVGAAFSHVLAPHNPFDLASLSLMDSFKPPIFSGPVGGVDPDWSYPLGTDDQGRDVLSGIMYGAQISLIVGACAIVFAAVVGISIGLLAGYQGGIADTLLMRVADIQLSFPAILIALLVDGVISAVLPRTVRENLELYVIIFAIGISLWPQFARTVRGSTMVERGKDYVLAARVIGLSSPRIMASHILPNVLGPVTIIATLNLGLAIINEATLSFLGVGLPPTQPSLGTLIRVGNDFLFSGEWWVTIGCATPSIPGFADGPALMALLDVQELTVEFPTRRGTLRALDHVSFSIDAGEVLGVVGESGAGKSLTGAAIIGLLEPPGRIAGGQILLNGRRIDQLTGEAMRHVRGKQIGAIFQDPLTTLNPLYSVGRQLVETMQTHLRLTDAEARKRAVGWLEQVGIPAPAERVNAYPHQFSGGMRQRVVIALALCAEPMLVIADEPTTALDVSVQAQIISLLRGLTRDHGTSVMLVTHDMGVIAETADRVAVMYAGRLAEIGAVADVVKHPAHPYSKGLMGSIPSLEHRVGRLTQIDGSMPRLNAIPRGCAFNPRCPNAFDRCHLERPELLPAGATRAACWLYAESPVHA
jgi:peptide/nickel transport system ATP-binding protein